MIYETEQGEWYLAFDGTRLIAGTCCNVGLLPSYYWLIDDYCDRDECLQEACADLDAIDRGEPPSGSCHEWQGSLVFNPQS